MADDLDRLQTALADRYVIERELGRGGMATVYLAHDVHHDRPVALKVRTRGSTSAGPAPSRPCCAHVPASRQPQAKWVRHFPHARIFIFWNGGLPPAFSCGISSRPHDQAYSTAGAFLREAGAGGRGEPVPELCRNRRQLRTTQDNRPEA
jgi:serine/threonine protein kinase